jgi:hypothetical protein
MASSEVSSSVDPAVLPQTSYAGLGRRVAAHFIDVVIAFLVLMAAGFFMRLLLVLGVWSVPKVSFSSIYQE